MRALVQRVSKANVKVENKITGKIESGLLVLLGIRDGDTEAEMKWVCDKLAGLRIFPDGEGKMNKSVKDFGNSILLISNFTLYGETKKGTRPSFSNAGRPELAEPLYEKTIAYLESLGLYVQTGIFGAMMDVELINWGPVTLMIEKEAPF